MHIHDTYTVKDSVWYYLPWYKYYYGYSENILVNKGRIQQDERAIKEVKINATNYKGTEQCIAIVAQETILSYWWKIFIAGQFVMAVFALLDGNYNILYHFTKLSKWERYFWLICNVFYKMNDLYSDYTYCFKLSHRNSTIAGILLLNMMLPYWTVNLLNFLKQDHKLA